MVEREKVLKGLNTPKLGDSLLKTDGTPWMADLAKMAPKLNWDDLTQTAALPLGSWLKTDPWDDTVHMLNAKRYAPMNARDKMPLEVTPIFFRLQRYDLARVQPPTAPAAAAPAAEAAAPPAGGEPAAAPAPEAAPPAGDLPAAAPNAAPPAPPPAEQPAAAPTPLLLRPRPRSNPPPAMQPPAANAGSAAQPSVKRSS